MRTRLTFLILALTLLSSSVAFAAQRSETPPWRTPLPEALPTAEILVGDTPLTVELARRPEETSLGLGYRNGLEDGTGMLFMFPDPSERTFWMKGMRFCLDIVWILDGEITGAAENACPDVDGTADSDRARFPSTGYVNYVLEVPAGWMAEHGYGPGTQVELPPELAQESPAT